MSKTYCEKLKCTTCCQWGKFEVNNVRLLPREKGKFIGMVHDPLKMASKENGDCVYLNREKGCTIHRDRPINCIAFDCRDMLYAALIQKDNVFTRTLISAMKLKIMEEANGPSKVLSRSSRIIRPAK